jgi:hypothetical protein
VSDRSPVTTKDQRNRTKTRCEARTVVLTIQKDNYMAPSHQCCEFLASTSNSQGKENNRRLSESFSLVIYADNCANQRKFMTSRLPDFTNCALLDICCTKANEDPLGEYKVKFMKAAGRKAACSKTMTYS